jgi:Enoyl-(Acyl carrier protein) reductase
MAVVTQPELLGRRADNARGVAALGAARWWRHRHRQLCECVSSGPWHHRLLCSQSRTDEFLQSVVQGARSQGHPHEHGEPRPGRDRAWLGPEGVAATVAKNSGVDVETAKQQVVASQGGFATGRFTRPDEVADLVLFLASERSGNITGADFVIDGGLIKTL